MHYLIFFFKISDFFFKVYILADTSLYVLCVCVRVCVCTLLSRSSWQLNIQLLTVNDKLQIIKVILS